MAPPVDAPPAPPKSRLKTLLKLGFGLSLLAALLLWNSTGRTMLGHLRQIDWIDALYLLGIAVVLNWVSSVKWKLFLAERGLRVSTLRLLGLYMVGKFFSNFLPSMIGGDATRVYFLGKHIDSTLTSFTSVFLERVTGMIALVTLATVFTVFNPDLRSQPLVVAIVAAAAAGTLAFLLLLGWEALRERLLSLAATLPGLGRLAPKLRRVFEDVLYFRARHRLLARAMVYSFAFHLLTGVNVYLAARAIDFHPSLLTIAGLTPVILLVNAVPVSPNNIGWWEWSFSLLLVGAGASAAEGLAVALTLRAANFVLSISGGLVYLLQRERPAIVATGTERGP